MRGDTLMQNVERPLACVIQKRAILVRSHKAIIALGPGAGKDLGAFYKVGYQIVTPGWALLLRFEWMPVAICGDLCLHCVCIAS